MDACFARNFKPGKFTDTGWPPLTERIATGGYPEVLTRTDAARRQAWFGSYVETETGQKRVSSYERIVAAPVFDLAEQE